MSVDPFLRKKWERIFYTFFDTNRNKLIDWNDFELLFEKVKELRGEESTEYKIVSDAMRMVWSGLLQTVKNIDVSHQQAQENDQELSITLDEWIAMWQKFNPKHMDIWQWEYLKYMFFLIDTSGDKLIDKSEYSTVMHMYGLRRRDAEVAFEKIAVDSTGKKLETLDYGQFVYLWNDYFTSTDPKKPGNYLFGPWP